jgi:segregation and condensation protein B
MSEDTLREDARAIEALLFLSPEPLSTETLAGLLQADRDRVLAAIDRLMAAFDADRGLEVGQIAGGWVLRTRPDMAAVCDRLRERPPEDRLSPAAMETLAVVAYLEPVSRPDIGRLRGVSVDSTVANLVERGLLEESGRADVSGAILYRTTRAFQQRFGLRDQRDLPPIERFELSGPQADDLRQRLSEAGHMDVAAEVSELEQGAPQPPDMAETPTVIQEVPVVTETPDGEPDDSDGESA